MIASMKNKGSAAVIGWAFDGYPIYGDSNPDGSAMPSRAASATAAATAGADDLAAIAALMADIPDGK